MPNLVITNSCNLDCQFCFASEYRGDEVGVTSRMTLDEFKAQVDFAGADTVRFCGGEPTLHPDFVAMLDFALAPTDRRVFIMTNGLWPAAVRARFAGLGSADRSRVTFLVNVLEPKRYTETQRRSLDATLGTLDPGRVTLGFTIFESPFDTAAIISLARSLNIRHLRYSVAAPTVTDPRSWNVEPERDFPAIAAIIAGLERQARDQRLRLQSDCGYIPPCMFDEQQLKDLLGDEDPDTSDRFRCHGPVDIGPGGEAWRCYGLYSTMRARTADFRHAGELGDHFETRVGQLSDQFLFDACHECDWRARGICGGGCFAFRSVRAMRAVADAEGIAIADEESLLAAVPSIDDQRLHLLSRGDETVVMLQDRDGTWADANLPAAEVAILRGCDGTRTVAAIAGDHDPAAVTRVVRAFFDQGGLRLRR